jgi:hypothetical protein
MIIARIIEQRAADHHIARSERQVRRAIRSGCGVSVGRLSAEIAVRR